MTWTVQIAHSIHELDPTEWDSLSAERPFQSHRWYVFGEKVMATCRPTYLVARYGDRAIARAAFWLIRNEPLPLPRILQAGFHLFFKHHPLLICRSPLADTSGLILPEGAEHREARDILIATAHQEMRRQRGSFLMFDFLDASQLSWLPGFHPVTVADPGTHMDIQWPSFQAYLEQRHHRGRWHYRRSMNEAEKMGLKLSKHRLVSDAHTAQALIKNVFQKHGSSLYPWMLPLLKNLDMVDSTWMEVHRDGKLVGCAAALRDGDAQLGTALGLEKDLPYAYFLLMYAILEDAFEHKVKVLRLGSGAYEFKQRLGFTREDNNHVGVFGSGWLSDRLMDLAASMN